MRDLLHAGFNEFLSIALDGGGRERDNFDIAHMGHIVTTNDTGSFEAINASC